MWKKYHDKFGERNRTMAAFEIKLMREEKKLNKRTNINSNNNSINDNNNILSNLIGNKRKSITIKRTVPKLERMSNIDTNINTNDIIQIKQEIPKLQIPQFNLNLNKSIIFDSSINTQPPTKKTKFE